MELIALRLKTFSNLRALEIRWPGASTQFLEEDYPFQLDSFAWRQPQYSHFSSSCASSVVKFLRKQPRMKHILYFNAPLPEPLPELPLLEIVVSDWDSFMPFLRFCKNIKAWVALSPLADRLPTASQAQALAPALNRLSILDIRSYQSWQTRNVELAALFPYLQNVEILHLSVSHPLEMPETLIAFVRSLLKLRQLTMNCSKEFPTIDLRSWVEIINDIPSIEVTQWVWIKHTVTNFAAEINITGSVATHSLLKESPKEVQLWFEPLTKKICDSMFSLSHAVDVVI
jgi:hypothetical protein